MTLRITLFFISILSLSCILGFCGGRLFPLSLPINIAIPEEGKHFIIPTDCDIVIITGEPSPLVAEDFAFQSGQGNIYKFEDSRLSLIFENVMWVAYLIYYYDLFNGIIIYVKG